MEKEGNDVWWGKRINEILVCKISELFCSCGCPVPTENLENNPSFSFFTISISHS